MDYNTNTFSSHQPFLIEILLNTTGDIIECGCGDGSTPIIYDIISKTNRKLISIDSDKIWLDKYNYDNKQHIKYFIDASNNDIEETGNKWKTFLGENVKNEKFEVVFIDSSPWISRLYILDYFKDKSEIIIIHDFDYYLRCSIKCRYTTNEICNRENKYIVYTDFVIDGIDNCVLLIPPNELPPTLIASNLLTKEKFDNYINIISSNINKYYINTKV